MEKGKERKSERERRKEGERKTERGERRRGKRGAVGRKKEKKGIFHMCKSTSES